VEEQGNLALNFRTVEGENTEEHTGNPKNETIQQNHTYLRRSHPTYEKADDYEPPPDPCSIVVGMRPHLRRHHHCKVFEIVSTPFKDFDFGHQIWSGLPGLFGESYI